MIAQWGRTTQRVVPLSRLGESSDFHDSLSRASPTLTSPASHLRAVARAHSEKIKAILFGPRSLLGTTKLAVAAAERVARSRAARAGKARAA